MIKKFWIILLFITMYGGSALLFLSLLFNWGAIVIAAGAVLLAASIVIAIVALRCPYCKKSAIKTHDLFTALKSGKCACAFCGKEIDVK